MKFRDPRLLSFVVLALAACGKAPDDETRTAAAGSLSDLVVTVDRSALAGAMVTIHANGRRTTVFTAADGRIQAPPEIDGTDGIDGFTVRYPGLEPVDHGPVGHDAAAGTIEMQAAADAAAAIPSSHWLALLPDGFKRREFILNCASCHGIAKSRAYLAGSLRDEAMWSAGIALMRALDAYSLIPPDFDDAEYAAWLAEHISEERLARLETPAPIAADLAGRVVITEYELPQSDSLPHDLVIGPDERIWITAFFYDQMWALDPVSGAYRKFDIDDDPDVVAQARALEFGADGRLWVVNGGTESVIRLDTGTGDYESFDVQMYPHSLDLDTAGNVWVNDYFAVQERIATVDAETGEVTIIEVPPANRPESEGIPLPYGLQVDKQNRLYSTQLAANTLVVYDTVSGEAKLHPMPAENSGPRRPGLAPDGSLWIPEFNTGHITRFDPETETFERVDLGLATIGAYDIEVDQNSGVVWVTGALDSSLFRYDPATGRADRIPLPTEPAYTRHLAIDPETGDVWTAYSSLPAAEPRVVRVHIADLGTSDSGTANSETADSG